jgi:methylenetetrahydrofolate reductase (NADPH)
MRKFHELVQVTKQLGYGHIPVLGNIFMLPLGAAKMMNSHQIPGCVVPDKLLKEIQKEAEAPDKGKKARYIRAAKMYAILKGIGCAGAHIGGHGMTHDDLLFILGHGEELAPNWRDLVREFDYPIDNGWYYFEKDTKTGLNTETPVDRASHKSAGMLYAAFRILHHTAFQKGGLLFGPMKAVAKAVDGTGMEEIYTKAEGVIKGITNGCVHCGDCGMFDTAYLCPQHECAKNQRNGPCGGGFDGWCEKFPYERQCIYVRAYDRLQAYGEEGKIGEGRIPPTNYALYQTSSWINFYLGRDHAAGPLGIETVPRKHPAKKASGH